ncbi:DUF2207 domain-containing protein [bacterium]|nr:DUF2207 domain-containing protein [bacterium]
MRPKIRLNRFFHAAPAAILIPLSLLHADERILSYHSDVKVRQDGKLIVEENIQVRAEGDQIRRGVYRDFPTRYKSRGNRYTVGLEVISVLKDGEPEPFQVSDQSNGKRIRIGNADVLLEPGEYRYTIRYNTTRQIGFFESHDELYWNVTGNGWAFPIDHASADIHLPENAAGEILETAVYTGPQGSTAADATISRDYGDAVRFETTRPLDTGEGLTVLVTWPKGRIAEPSRTERTVATVRDNPGMLAGLLGLLLVFAYYLYFWFKVGRDPEKGAVFPLYRPPVDLSPSAMRYIRRMGFDHKVLTASLISMAVKKAVRIEQKGSVYTLHRLSPDPGGLTDVEQKIADALFSGKDSVTLKNTEHSRIQSALKAGRRGLESKYHKTYFFNNRSYFVPGLLLSVLALAAGFFLRPQAETLFLGLWVTLWSVGCAFLLIRVIAAWREVFQGGGFSVVRIGAAVFLSLFSMPFFGGEIFALYGLSKMTDLSMIAVIFGLILLNVLFYRLLKAPTPIGRKAMDKIEGFRMYLTAAESKRMNILHPPGRTPELFEAYLPFAIALDVEQQWAEQFADVLARAGDQPGGYSPAWYHSSGRSGFNAQSFASSIGGSFSSAISSASTPPGSSSGSGGGGSSGGGGGGGGGGGW